MRVLVTGATGFIGSHVSLQTILAFFLIVGLALIYLFPIFLLSELHDPDFPAETQ
jgi:hypothetical protein